MTAKPVHAITFDPSLVDQLACPACLGALFLQEIQLVCKECGRAYPIGDGIPVLIVERAMTAPR
jgi:uncharacterized protein YbaR (Trm112 family)